MAKRVFAIALLLVALSAQGARTPPIEPIEGESSAGLEAAAGLEARGHVNNMGLLPRKWAPTDYESPDDTCGQKIKCGDGKMDWETCWKDFILPDYRNWIPCLSSNVIVYRTKDNWNNDTEPEYLFTVDSIFPDNPVTDCFVAKGAMFNAMCFHEPAKFITEGYWDDISLWNFLGSYAYTGATGIVEFFKNPA